MTSDASEVSKTSRAVVLGGGGVIGISWEVGILAGFEEAGVGLAQADAIIGTSAGSFAGAYLASRDGMVEPYARQFSDDVKEISASMTPESIEKWQAAIVNAKGDPKLVALGLGKMALEATTVSTEDRREVVVDRLGMTEWPEGPLRMTAVDANTGELVVFTKDSGIALELAAAATGAVPGLWPVVHALGRSWIDGGVGTPINALLAKDFKRVVIIAPVAVMMDGRNIAEEEADALRANSDVIVISPNDKSREAMGDNVFDTSRRGIVAEAGRLQGLEMSTAVNAVWSDSEID